MKKRIKFLEEVGVFLISTIFILTSVMVTADTVENTTFPKDADSIIQVDYNKSPAPTDAIMFSQLPFEPVESWIFRISDTGAGYRVWDEFWSITEEICGIYWWGLSLSDSENWTSCNPEGMVFEIIFWDALLGNPVCTYQVAPKAKGTFEFYNGSKMFYWDIGLDPCCDYLSDGWISIQSIENPNQCYFLWAGSDDGDLYSYQEGASNPDCNTDCAFELYECGPLFEPKIQCDSFDMNFGKARPETNVTGQIYVYNVGEFYSWLSWFVDTANVPAWGTWTFLPASGYNLREYDYAYDYVLINVTCVLTSGTGTFNGTIIVYNADDSTEFCGIDTSVDVRKVRSQNAFILNLFQRFPLLERILTFLFN